MTAFVPSEQLNVSDMAEDIRTRGADAVLSVVEDIRTLAATDRDWACHGIEDNLYAAVLYAMSAVRMTDIVAMALTALETKELDFPRYTM